MKTCPLYAPTLRHWLKVGSCLLVTVSCGSSGLNAAPPTPAAPATNAAPAAKAAPDGKSVADAKDLADPKAVAPVKVEEPPVYNNWINFGFGTLMVSGDKAQLAHQNGVGTGEYFGGIEEMHVQKEFGKGGLMSLDGRAIFNNHDYDFKLELSKTDLGYLKAGYTSFRTWYSDNGGNFPNGGARNFGSMFSDDMSVDRENLWVEMGLRMPNIPKITLRYSRETRDGQKDATTWGPTTNTGLATAPARLIVPALRELNEIRNVFTVEMDHTLGNTEINVGGRYENTKNRDVLYMNRNPRQPALPAASSPIRVTQHDNLDTDLFSGHGSTVTRFNDKFWLTTAYAYSTLDSDVGGSRIYGSKFNAEFNPLGTSPQANGFKHLHGGGSVQQHVANINLMWMPIASLTIIPEVKFEDITMESDVNYIRTKVAPQPLDPNVHIWSANDTRTLSEALDIRFTGIDNLVLYARADWEQEQGTRQDDSNEAYNAAGTPLSLDEDSRIRRQKYVVGANFYPLSRLNCSIQYYYKTSEFSNKIIGDDPKTLDNQRMMNLNSETDDVNFRITWRPLPTLTFVTRWDWMHTEVHSRWKAPNPAALDNTYPYVNFHYGLASETYNHVYSESITWNPFTRWYVQASGSYVLNKIQTPASGNVKPDHLVMDSQNDYYTVSLTSGLALDDKTTIQGDFTYYNADNYDRRTLVAMPYGAAFDSQSATVGITRKVSRAVQVYFKYAYFNSHDETSGGLNDYTGHMLYAGTQVKF